MQSLLLKDTLDLFHRLITQKIGILRTSHKIFAEQAILKTVLMVLFCLVLNTMPLIGVQQLTLILIYYIKI